MLVAFAGGERQTLVLSTGEEKGSSFSRTRSDSRLPCRKHVAHSLASTQVQLAPVKASKPLVHVCTSVHWRSVDGVTSRVTQERELHEDARLQLGALVVVENWPDGQVTQLLSLVEVPLCALKVPASQSECASH
jgi:hypothetical protein